ncbi:hypothetical protein [Ethanoligenens harbinense]|uniref:Uncharacterized protein n=1 Tax=Ethanoligenens harbinense (strain DSM 18485 / JCM 12961 / CGMCC 1.5033 / YUAN-3) TaxID=663278 RepID=E6U3F4_ETHHY|nr:hypothetical protein [Ethanoligenens harbinense]ADU26446.1 hypothetical protein Ethha_0883 [Ethanoligenens harbinense YUAN-3]AVQ95571.1 hypothetical protein CXQ68_04575 [Ethanoligenens harbinense YUAN-3]AYF38235.1 hypothetical protein CXP51_04435 [Ethanoligenens harbinense]AYF40980.1 hypothetical protein CN246_04565 [Ethanoligenens harbinense]QCN91811.1 hypothetical protein DRA42_04580 [Ethanoligenens harbinense]
MNLEELFLKGMREYSKMIDLLGKIFYLERELPEQVFQSGYQRYFFEEFDWATSSEFWGFIQTLSKETSDNYIFTAVLNLDSISYQFEEFGHFGSEILPVDLTGNDYFEFLDLGPKGNNADSILSNSNIIVWASPSMKWGIFGERAYGTCILAFSNDFKATQSIRCLKSWKSVNQAIDMWIPLNFRNCIVPNEIINSFRKNYSF